MTDRSSWLARQRTRANPRMRLLCLPYAGGGSAIYRGYGERVPADVEVWVAQLPGREKRFGEPALTSVDAIADNLAAALLAPQCEFLSLPYAFFGHSLGALVGFELVRRLRDAGIAPPARLFASAHRAPQLPDPDPPIHGLPDAEFAEELRTLNGTPAEVFESPELLELVLPMLRADFTAAETYAYRDAAPLACPITVFGGRDDHWIGPDALDAWREQTAAECRVQIFDGDHFFIHSAQQALLSELERELEQLLGAALRAGRSSC
ncbi:MAG: thioesterase [Ectothiorhodospiraceae bacterium]|nr:thioesterase [Chromatiales bacterium]MCP5155947.1 thioesterase [Ectothiorhodospiraceae bacterium]